MSYTYKHPITPVTNAIFGGGNDGAYIIINTPITLSNTFIIRFSGYFYSSSPSNAYIINSEMGGDRIIVSRNLLTQTAYVIFDKAGGGTTIIPINIFDDQFHDVIISYNAGAYSVTLDSGSAVTGSVPTPLDFTNPLPNFGIMARLYTSGAPPPREGTNGSLHSFVIDGIISYKFDEGEGHTILDYSGNSNNAILHFSSSDTESTFWGWIYVSVDYTDYYKFGDAFSITNKFADWIGNPLWKEGYTLVDHPSGLSNEYTPFWEFVSAVSEETGSEIYSKVKHMIQNLRDIDLCELYYLKAIAKELGYFGDVSFLDYNYPLEIYNLLNIFSINKDLLLKTNKVLHPNSIQTLYQNTAMDAPTGIFDPFVPSAMGVDDATRLLEVSGATSGLYYTTDEAYQLLIDSAFSDCLSTFVNYRYREDEELSLSGTVPIWEHISIELVDDNLFKNERSFDPTIEQRKIELGIPVTFNEKDIIDSVNEHIYTLDDFTTSEQIILNLELDRREGKRTEYSSISRHSPERENKVKKYFNFIDIFNSDTSTSYIDYDVESKYFELSGNENVFLTTDGTDYVLNTNYIIRSAAKLRNIALRTSYLREELKRLVRKYNLTGSELIIKIIVKDLIKKYIYNSSDDWRYSPSGNELITTNEISENRGFDVDIIEYFDTTEYMNISSTGTPSGASETLEITDSLPLNNRYWETDEVSLNDISQTTIEDFYKNIVGLDLDVVDDEYSSKLSDFLHNVFNHSAVEDTIDNLTTGVSSLITSGIPEELGPTIIGTEWLSSGNWDITLNSTITSAVVTGVVFVDDDYVDTTGISAIRLEVGSTETSPGTFTIDNVNPFMVGDLYSIDLYSLRGSLTSTQRIVVSGPAGDETNPVLSEVSANFVPQYIDFPELTGVWENGSIHFTTTVTAPTAYTLSVVDMETGATNEVWIASATVNRVITPGVDEVIEYTYSSEGANAYIKYTGLPEGTAPFANFKNSYHSSYALHPYISNMFEKQIDQNILQGIIDYNVETQAESYLSGNISERIDVDGNTIDSWRSSNIESNGYQTKYESSVNTDHIGSINKNMDIDGTFNYNALSDFLNDPTTFISSVSAGTNDYYQNIGLTVHGYEYISLQLTQYESAIRELSGKSIYKYTTDQYDNHYILYKNTNDYSEVGELWIRLNDHPLALPAFDFDGNVNSSYAQLDLWNHGNARSYADIIYDIGMTSNIFWMATNNKLSPKILIGEISIDFDTIKNRNILSYQKNKKHNIELIDVPSTHKYVGVSVLNGVINVVMIESDIDNGLPINEDNYQINLKYELFDNETYGRSSEFAKSILIKYNESRPYDNTYTLEWNSDILSIGFESESPSGTLTNYIGYEETSGGTTDVSAWSTSRAYSDYDNGITIIDISINNTLYGGDIYKNEDEQDGIHYFYQSADLTHYPLYDAYNQVATFDGIDDYVGFGNMSSYSLSDNVLNDFDMSIRFLLSSNSFSTTTLGGIGKDPWGQITALLYLGYDSGGNHDLNINIRDSSNYHIIDTGFDCVTGIWYDARITYDGSGTLRMYVDDVETSNSPNLTAMAGSMVFGATNNYVGCGAGKDGIGTYYELNGMISDFRIKHYVDAKFNEGYGPYITDYSGYNNTGIVDLGSAGNTSLSAFWENKEVIGYNGINYNSQYANTRVPVNTFDFQNVGNVDYSQFILTEEAIRYPSELNIQLSNKIYEHSIGRFELLNNYFIDMHKEDIPIIGNTYNERTFRSIYLTSPDFRWVFNASNGVNNQEHRLYANLYVNENIVEGDSISVEDLQWTETGDAISWESDSHIGTGLSGIYSNYTFTITDFKESKLKIESSPATWTNEH